MDFKEIGKYLQEKIEGLYFNCTYTCTYGETWIDRLAGTSKNFIMWKGIIIWEDGILEINPGCEGIEKEVTLQVLNLLDTKFIHALGSNNFDDIKDYYQIKGIKFQEPEIEYITCLEELEEVEELDESLEPVEEDDLEYIISCQIKEKNIEILNTIKKYPEEQSENYWRIGININSMSEEELQSLSIIDRDFY